MFRGIMTPSAALTLVFGFGILHSVGLQAYVNQGWLHAKFALIALLIVYHIYCGICMRRFRLEANKHSSRFYRIFNEIPVLILVAIIILAVVRPF